MPELYCPLDGKRLRFIEGKDKSLYYICEDGHMWEVKHGKQNTYQLKELFILNRRGLEEFINKGSEGGE